MTERTATLSFSDGSPSVTFPVLPGTLGPDVIDIRTLYAKTDRFTYDPGFLSTASCQSSITFIDGDKGELLYRGYPIEELAVKCDFLEVCYLLLYGELPNETQRKDFDDRVTYHTMVNEQMQFFMRGFRRDAERRGHRHAGPIARHDRQRTVGPDRRTRGAARRVHLAAARAVARLLTNLSVTPRSSRT